MEPFAGGTFSLRVHVRGDEYSIKGTVTSAVAGSSITLEWNWQSTSPVLGSANGTTVNIEFLAARKGVDVVITHDSLASEEVRDAYIRGWRRCLEGMSRVVDSTDRARN